MLDSLVRVSRRVACNHYASILAGARSSVQVGCIAPRAITLPGGSHIPEAFVQPPRPMLACARPSAPVLGLARVSLRKQDRGSFRIQLEQYLELIVAVGYSYR